VPHAGEVVGPASIWGAIDGLGADRVRHGIRAVEDPILLRELADRRIVLDVTPVSNVRTGIVKSLGEHPLPELVAAGIPCTVSTDDPEMFDTDLTREYEAVTALGLDPRGFYDAAVEGALCDEPTRERLRQIGDEFDWRGPPFLRLGAGERLAEDPTGLPAALEEH
jgi:aminodeoxyfutalosine deaminase